MAAVLEMMYKDILEFHQQALRVFGKSSESRKSVRTSRSPSHLSKDGESISAQCGATSIRDSNIS